jgi:hypothetical protein
MSSPPVPVSNSTRWRPVLTTTAFCSNSTASTGRKLRSSNFLMSSALTPASRPSLGGPTFSGPSETTVTSKEPSLKR